MSMSAAYSIRLASVSDAAALASLASQTFIDTYAEQNTRENLAAHLQESYTQQRQAREINDPTMVTLLVESLDELVGFAQMRRDHKPDCVTDPSAIEIWRFYISVPWHGKGVAAALMDRCVLEARQRDAQSVWLGVYSINFKAQRFYQKMGFEAIGEHVFTVGDDPQRDFVLSRAVNGPVV